MSFRTTTLLRTLFVWFGLTSCLLTMGAKEKLVVKSASFDLRCETSLLTIKEIGKDAFSVMGCNQKASYVVECANADTDGCKAVLVSVTN